MATLLVISQGVVLAGHFGHKRGEKGEMMIKARRKSLINKG
jgi:hypothetical protein